MKVLSVYNIKGGVGKTTTAVHLAHVASAAGQRTLIWDLDPQGSATYCLHSKARVKGGSTSLLESKRELHSLIHSTHFTNLDILPADFSYRHFDTLLNDVKKPLSRLHKVLKPIRETYDVVILDCPPGITLLSEAIFGASDALIVPTMPTTLSLRTLKQLIDFKKEAGLKQLKLLAFLSMVDQRKSLHKRVLESRKQLEPWVLNTWIPYASGIELMTERRMPVTASHPTSILSQRYRQLWQDILDAMHASVRHK
ncbi:MAG: hypothetical protein AUJ57_01285 [Zetaproteobacteria bacterium CG1_02_53_45]|nr:MAG: hypothetical protein AUJ57_01285 [Zetaproteobacteria bacterium CG1_02_53_45]